MSKVTIVERNFLSEEKVFDCSHRVVLSYIQLDTPKYLEFFILPHQLKTVFRTVEKQSLREFNNEPIVKQTKN